jgi:hypothetical protein
MATILGRDASVYWGSGTPFHVLETRNVSIDEGAEFVEDTVHGDVNRSYSPTFTNFNASVTGLLDTVLGKSDEIRKNAANKTSGKFSIYGGDSNRYWYGSGYVSVDDASLPYDDYAGFNWSVRPIGTVGFYAK